LVTDVDPGGAGVSRCNIAEKQYEPGDRGRLKLFTTARGEVGKSLSQNNNFNGGVVRSVNLVIQSRVDEV
jgi:hypothetical protein